MKRELWSIGCTFGYAIRVLNSIFCFNNKEEQEYSKEDKWLVAEQVNSLCSDAMIEDAYDIIRIIWCIPGKRLCERTDCIFHHPNNINFPEPGHIELCKEKCGECVHNKYMDIGKEKEKRDMDYFESI